MTELRLAYRQRYPLPRGYEVEFALDGLELKVEWLPELPHYKVGRKLLPAYREARNSFLASLGISFTVIDL